MMYSKRTGAGTLPLVFVHGFGCSHEDWEAQRKALETRHEVVACDLPGHGRTPGEVKDAIGTTRIFALSKTGIVSDFSRESRAVLEGYSIQAACR